MTGKIIGTVSCCVLCKTWWHSVPIASTFYINTILALTFVNSLVIQFPKILWGFYQKCQFLYNIMHIPHYAYWRMCSLCRKNANTDIASFNSAATAAAVCQFWRLYTAQQLVTGLVQGSSQVASSNQVVRTIQLWLQLWHDRRSQLCIQVLLYRHILMWIVRKLGFCQWSFVPI